MLPQCNGNGRPFEFYHSSELSRGSRLNLWLRKQRVAGEVELLDRQGVENRFFQIEENMAHPEVNTSTLGNAQAIFAEHKHNKDCSGILMIGETDRLSSIIQAAHFQQQQECLEKEGAPSSIYLCQKGKKHWQISILKKPTESTI